MGMVGLEQTMMAAVGPYWPSTLFPTGGLTSLRHHRFHSAKTVKTIKETGDKCTS